MYLNSLLSSASSTNHFTAETHLTFGGQPFDSGIDCNLVKRIKMRWKGSPLPHELISLLLQLKSFPASIRQQIARDIQPKSDESVATASEDYRNFG